MRKAKKLSNKLMAILLSASMVFAPVIQSMPVYAAEPVIEEGSADTLTDDATTDEPADDNNDSDTPAADNGDSENQGTENGDTENPGMENGDSDNSGTENGDADNSGTENGDSGNTGNENGDSDNSGTEDGDSENPGTEDGDTENPEDPEDPDAEDGDSEDLGDAEADESLDGMQSLTLEAVEVKEAKVRGTKAVNVSAFASVGGWNESIYAEIAGIDDTDVVDVEYSGASSGKLSANKVHESNETDLDYLVRKVDGNVRIDIPGLKEGTYTLKVTLGSNKQVLEKSGIQVYKYDRSGYAHFNYSSGVGAYKDDGTLKDNAIVLYVNKDTVNTVTLKVGNTTVTGIGNILNSVGKECGEAGHDGQCRRVSGTKVYYAKANTNQNVITKLSEADIPLVVRFIGAISDSGLNGVSGTFNAASTPKIDGLTIYNEYDNGGSPGDNGHMARIQSGKNITLEGIGYDATIDGWGFHFMAETSTTSKGFGKSFEVRNLKFVNTPEDAIGMEGQQDGTKISAGVERCWVHNNEFYCPSITSPAESDKSEGDGSVDFKRGMYFTCSYNYFDSCHKTNLVGSSDKSLQYNLTYHHNYWYMCKARGPLTRQANVHMYNNIFDMQTDYAMNTRANAYIFSESNLFYACKSPHAVEDGAIKSWHDSITSVLYNKGKPGTAVSSREEAVSSACAYNGTSFSSFENDSNLFYKNNYQLQDGDFFALREVIVSQTGIQKRNPKRPEDVKVSDYSVIPRMPGGSDSEIEKIDISAGDVTKTPGKKSKKVYAFEVTGAAFDLEVEYTSAIVGVLVNEAGENLLEGNGKVTNLPVGKYMLQALTFQPGDPKKGTIAVFKDFTIGSVKFSQHDPTAHVHKYELMNTIPATCTEAGKKIYECKAVIPDGGKPCTEKTKEETIPMLGHDYKLVAGTGTPATCKADGSGTFRCSNCNDECTGIVPMLDHKWGNWTTTKEATADEEGEEERVCAYDTERDHVQTKVIPAGGSGTVNPTPGPDIVTPAGDYELYFKKSGKNVVPNGDTDFFTLTSAKYKSDKGPINVDGNDYTDCFYIDSSAQMSFNCNEGASLYMVLDVSGKKLDIDGTLYTSDDNGIITISDLGAGKHTIKKGGGSTNLFIFYVSVNNGAVEETYYRLSFDYNYDDAPEAKEVQVLENSIYSEEELLTLASLTRRDYTLKGLYTDPFCQNAVTYPYSVRSNATLYADWIEDGDNEVVEKTYSLIFESKGGTSVATVRVSENQLYRITQRPTKDGYAFAGWYDAETNGNLVEVVDGTKLTGNMTVYAYWNLASDSFSLDCAVDLSGADIPSTPVDSSDTKKGRNITERVTKNGFTLHALSGESEDGTKNYMTVHASDTKTDASATNPLLLYTNGVILDNNTTDPLLKTIEFEAPGAGELTVKVAASGSLKNDSGTVTHTCTIVLGKMENGVLTEVFTRSLTDTTQREIAIDIDSAGKYYLYAAKQKAGALPVKGVAYSSISFSQPQYTILFQTNGGTATGIDVNGPKAVDDTITLPTTCTLDGYIFEGWLIGDSTTPVGKDTVYTYTVKDEDSSNGVITITAKYTPVNYTIKYEYGDGTMDSATVTAVAGSEVQLPKPTPPEDKVFVGWTIGEGDAKRTLTTSYTVRAEDADSSSKTITFTAEYKDKPVVYTIKFDGNGGSLPTDLENDKSLEEGKRIDLRGYEPTSADQRFIGWQIGNGKPFKDSYTVKASDAVEKVITLKAVYATEYAVHFDAGTGTLAGGTVNDAKYIEGETVTLGTCTPATDSGEKFTGWYIGDDSTTVYKASYTVKASDAVEKVITLKARYINENTKTYTVTLVLDGGSLVGSDETPTDDKIELSYAEDEYFNEKAEKAGHKFTGWTLDGKKITLPYPVKKDVTLTAAYEEGEEGPSHEGIAIIGLKTSYDYTGAKIIPNIGVVDYNIGNGKLLAPGVDYTVKYKDNKNPGNATITVTGKGNYAGKDFKKTFKIEEVDAKKAGLIDKDADLLDLKGAKLDKINSVEYNGEEQHPDFKLTLKGEAAVTYTYKNGCYEIKEGNEAGTKIAANVAVSNNVNKGTATILITGAVNGKKATSVKKTFKITAIDLAKNASKVSVSTTAGTYSVKGAAPGSITVTYGDKELRKGTDYTVKYTGNKKATTSPTAQVVITGKGNYAKKYTGTDTTYSINKLDMSKLTVKAVNACEGIKAGNVTATVLDNEGNILKPSQYTIKVYSDDETDTAYESSAQLAKGTIWVVAEAKDTANLQENTATAKAEFTVAEKNKNIAKAKIKLNKDTKTNKTITKTYNGKEQELSAADLTVTIKGQEKPLVMGDDFVIAGYSNNINKGTATAIIKGIGSYSGTKTVKFKIVGKTMVIDGEDNITWDDITDVITSFMNKLVK